MPETTYHYTYLITNISTGQENSGKKYIGVRRCQCSIKDDPYMGSSKSLTADIKLLGKENFKKDILMTFATREQAIRHEIKLHEKHDVAVNESYYNKAKQTSIGFDSTGTKNTGGAAFHKGRKRTSKTRRNISKSLKGKPKNHDQRGIKNGMYKHSYRTPWGAFDALKPAELSDKNKFKITTHTIQKWTEQTTPFTKQQYIKSPFLKDLGSFDHISTVTPKEIGFWSF